MSSETARNRSSSSLAVAEVLALGSGLVRAAEDMGREEEAEEKVMRAKEETEAALEKVERIEEKEVVGEAIEVFFVVLKSLILRRRKRGGSSSNRTKLGTSGRCGTKGIKEEEDRVEGAQAGNSFMKSRIKLPRELHQQL